MNSNDFAHLVSLKAGLTNEEAEALLGAFVATISDELKSNSQIDIENMGSFTLKDGEISFTPGGELLELTK